MGTILRSTGPERSQNNTYIIFLVMGPAHAAVTQMHWEPRNLKELSTALCSYFNYILFKEMQRNQNSYDALYFRGFEESWIYCRGAIDCLSLSLVSCSCCEEKLWHIYSTALCYEGEFHAVCIFTLKKSIFPSNCHYIQVRGGNRVQLTVRS